MTGSFLETSTWGGIVVLVITSGVDRRRKEVRMISKVFYFLLVFGIGILTGFQICDYDRSQPKTFTREEIVLVIPKTKDQINRQLIYSAATTGMLQEVQRQMRDTQTK